MSKSKNNGVDPQSLIEHYGADTARFFMMFAAPPEQTLEWSDSGIEGSFRFIRRIWNFAQRFIQEYQPHIRSQRELLTANLHPLRREIHLTLKQANHDFQKFQFNTVASAGMKILNALERAPHAQTPLLAEIIEEGLSILLRLLSPITPHITHHLWREIGLGEDILTASWPEAEESAMAQDEIELMLQINGKLRGSIFVPASADKAQIEHTVLATEVVQKHLEGNLPKKIIVVPNRLVNIVI